MSARPTTAYLTTLRRINAVKADALAVNIDRIAVDDRRPPYEIGEGKVAAHHHGDDRERGA